MGLSALKVSSCLASHVDAFLLKMFNFVFDFSAHLDVHNMNLFQSAQQLFAVHTVTS